MKVQNIMIYKPINELQIPLYAPLFLEMQNGQNSITENSITPIIIDLNEEENTMSKTHVIIDLCE